jgi:competence protein CoiA
MRRMIYACTDGGARVEAAPERKGWCPNCQAALIPRCGEIVAWHWAHYARPECDPWWEPESRWHRTWKERVGPECREVVMGDHRADIRLPTGVVIELQASSLAPADIRAREQFYGRMGWIWKAGDFAERLYFRHRDGFISFRWDRPRPMLYAIRRPLFWDLEDGTLFHVKRLYPHRPGLGHTGGWGQVVPVDPFVMHCLSQGRWPAFQDRV